jgi:hypothetical protein
VSQIIPLTGKLDDLYKKKRYARLFDHVFLSSQHCHTLQVDSDQDIMGFTELLRDEAAVSVESPM